MHSSILSSILAVSVGGILGNLLLHIEPELGVSLLVFFFLIMTFYYELNGVPDHLTLQNIFAVVSGQAVWLVGFF